jgi:hypothetical protein
LGSQGTQLRHSHPSATDGSCCPPFRVIGLTVDTVWSATVISVFTRPPIQLAIYDIVRLVPLSWLYLVSPERMKDSVEEEKDHAEGWAFVYLWKRYAIDRSAGPVLFHRSSKEIVIHAIMMVLFVNL